ncbi:uncharacterized protein TNCV_1329071 [Trichonephila clavipes]|nr:uncharacterized protein TNCV_1329071 [Trichonephila clavipes]
MRNIDKELSFPTFAIIIVNMVGLFWEGYRLAFRNYMSAAFMVCIVSSGICYLMFQLLIMISASMTNEMAEEVKSSLLCIKYRFPPDLRETKLKEVCTKKSNLTLWKIYVMDRSVLITSFGTLLTYGILIGTLGEEN